MKKRNKQLAWSRLSLAAPLLVAIIGACGGTTQGPQVGSESHFLGYCSGTCRGGLECIAEICTRPCLTATSSCSDLALGAACTNQSVEPGQVAVCDLACNVADDCKALGTGYTCSSGFCRGPGGGGIGNGGSGGTSSSNGDCHLVGRYETGKEGGYLPCCAGLNEIFTLSLVEGEGGTPACQQLPLRTYACIQGTCGDGVCEDPERSCGCLQDCGDVPLVPVDEGCPAYRDQSPPPVVHTVSIVNTSARTLYVWPRGGCGQGQSLVSVERGGQPLNVLDPGCARTCEGVLDNGSQRPANVTPEFWESSADSACAGIVCGATGPIPIAAGETLTEVARLELREQRMPRACAADVLTDAIGCYSRLIPQMGSTTIVTAFLEESCSPGACPAITATATGNYFFEDLTIVLDGSAD
jgi:hypothetical protein